MNENCLKKCKWQVNQSREYNLKSNCVKIGSLWLWTFLSKILLDQLISERDVLNYLAVDVNQDNNIHTIPFRITIDFHGFVHFDPKQILVSWVL